jgi:arylsulfatase A-like enzyme
MRRALSAAWAFTRRALPLRLGALNAVLTLLQLGFIAYFSGHDYTDIYARGPRIVAPLLVTVVNVNLLVQLFLSLGGRHAWLRALLGSLLAFVTFALLAYHKESCGGLDPALLANGDAPLGREVWDVVVAAVDRSVLLLAVPVIGGLLWLDRRFGVSFPEQPGPVWRNALLCGVPYVSVVLLPVEFYDQVSDVLAAWLRHESPMGASVVLAPGSYPLVHATPAPSRPPPERRPDMFLVMVESFNARMVEAKTPQGQPYTPYFDSLIPRGLYVERFYSNSIQTSKGQFATFCSLVPLIHDREFVALAERHFQCLPAVLRQAGYATVYFQGHRHLTFDNTQAFLGRNGFERVETVATHQRPEDDAYVWGWGLQDDRFYSRFFEYLDQEIQRQAADRPIFSVLAPIGSHMRFDKVPLRERALYPNPSRPDECYANAIRVADRGLAAFFRELRRRPRFEQAIVVVTGDHSFPMGEHGHYHNESDAYEEFFRTPLLAIGAGRIAPERIRSVPYSQLDIAPTLLELSGVRPAENHFMGVSFLALPRVVHPFCLVQPYAGRYLGVIDFPFKYVYRMHGGKQRLYDLVGDPLEQHNLLDLPAFAERQSRMHELLNPCLLEQAALVRDQIWPHGSPVSTPPPAP